MNFTSPMLKASQLPELFSRAHESKEYDQSEYGEPQHKNATVIDYLNWASEEVLANQ